MTPNDNPFQGPNQTVIHLASGASTITLEDARDMKDALLNYLKKSNEEDRDYLIRMTEKVPAWIDPQGFVRIGAWLLQARGNSLVFTYRMPSGRESSRVYVAHVDRDSRGWKVTKMESERINLRRP